MSAVDELFRNLRLDNKKAFMPFVTAGDPDLDFTVSVIKTLERCGSSMVEIGIPYSDPIADGPVIQASYTRALEGGVKLSQILAVIDAVSSAVTIPLVTMVSYAMVHRYGLANYVRDARAVGLAGAIVPDLLVEEADDLARICQDHDFSLIQLVTPTTPKERAVRIANTSTGFLYYVSVTGITGERTELPADLVENVGWLRSQTDLPICIGFGISQPEHVRLLAAVADGLIVGSAIVKWIAQCADVDREIVEREIEQYAKSLTSALP